MASRRKKIKGFVALSPAGTSYSIEKRMSKWYILGRNVNGLIVPLGFSTNKQKLLRYVKQELGFEVL